MHLKAIARFTLPALALALTLSACSDVSERASQLTAPESAYMNKGGAAKLKALRTTFSQANSADTQELHGNGGLLRAGPYSLVVPPGAVNKPTVFHMALRTDGVAGVTLTAHQKVNGSLRDVGSQGFKKDLILALSYDGLESQFGGDPSQLLVAWDRGNGNLVPVRSEVNTQYKVVYGYLKHFSDYALAFP